MQAMIRYPDAQRMEVVVLSISSFTMRVIPRLGIDTMELTRQYGEWRDETGRTVEFDSFVVDDENDFRLLNTLATETHYAAGA